VNTRDLIGDTTRRLFLREVAGLPTPPVALMRQVLGTRRPAEIPFRYASGGLRASEDIRAILAANDLKMRDFDRILDFGCGCGRVIRYWKGLPVTGCDYNAELIEWCRKHLPFSFDTNQVDPPLPYEPLSFDFIYALSVFTHLDEQRQYAWRDEFERVLRPGGILLFTTMGSRLWRGLSDRQLAKLERGGVVYKKSSGEIGENLFGTYQSPEQVVDQLAGGFEVLDSRPWGAVGLGGQDLWLFRKPSNSSPRTEP
jgi:SAM-dependent methyltransferase